MTGVQTCALPISVEVEFVVFCDDGVEESVNKVGKGETSSILLFNILISSIQKKGNFK